MRKRTSLLRWPGLLLALAVFVLPGLYAAGANGAEAAGVEGRADVIVIDAMAADGKLELPPVVFLHDKHTEAMKAAQKDCSSCHQPLKAEGSEEGQEGSTGYSFSYKTADMLRGQALKAMYHQSCIGCHAEAAAMGKKTGPQKAECRRCHNPRPVKSAWTDIGLDKVAHNKHVASKQIMVAGQDKNCAACHHVYDAEAQKLVWGKNKEDSCRACHMLPEAQKAAAAKNAAPGAPDLADENGLILKRPTLDRAAHQSCVNCHLNVTALKQPDLKSGPDTCAGCHSQAALTALAEESAKVDPASVPRLERGQDDAVFMLPAPAASENAGELKGMMRPVSFNHKFHESVSMDCRSCHHKKIAACSSCHSYEGKAEGEFVTWATAMHKSSSERSCMGCHAVQTKTPSCIGCHAVTPERPSQASCSACHTTPAGLEAAAAEDASLLKLDKDAQKALALATVKEREARRAATYDKDDIPEKAKIGVLSNEYQPSELPHRKIVDTLMDKQKDSRLAAVFHQDKGTLCQGCHHNSPLSKTPPKCVACHGVGVKSVSGYLPLKAAYHQQCMSCHAGMNQKPAATECVDCHKTRER